MPDNSVSRIAPYNEFGFTGRQWAFIFQFKRIVDEHNDAVASEQPLPDLPCSDHHWLNYDKDSLSLKEIASHARAYRKEQIEERDSSVDWPLISKLRQAPKFIPGHCDKVVGLELSDHRNGKDLSDKTRKVLQNFLDEPKRYTLTGIVNAARCRGDASPSNG